MIHASTCQLAPSSEGARPKERAEKPPPSSPADQTPTRGGARRPWAPGQETESEETESLTAGQGLSYSIQWAGCQSSTTCENKWYRDNDLGTQRACKMHHVHTHSTPVDNITDTERGKQNTHTDRRRNRSDCLTCFGLIPS